tara:strand:+ start:166 stop:408 length:243 start_codon:yes stop_codon:yes gene_type:complete
MKLTTQRLKRLIREELNKMNEEAYNKAYSWWYKNDKENFRKWQDDPSQESAMLKQCAEETGMSEEEAKEALDNMKYDQLD